MTRSKLGKRPSAAFLLAVATLALAGCPKKTDSEPPPTSGGDAARVAEACGRCHASPEPSILPKERWKTLVPEMAGLPGKGKALTKDEIVMATAYFVANAPKALGTSKPAKDDGKLGFTVENFTPPNKKLQDMGMPSVANVSFGHLSDAKRKDLLISDMRTSSLMILSPWREGKQRRMRRLSGGLAYPVHAVLTDANGDGWDDILIASHGGMHPSNDTKGAATIMLQMKNRRFLTIEAASGLGRVTDVRAADLDGDGDKDLAVAAFGWRGPGKLVVLENKGPKGNPKPTYTSHELDDRDGFIHAEFADVDGDGKLDIVAVLSQEHEQVVAFLNNGGLKFDATILHRAPHPSWGYSGMQLVDMDGDKDMDVLVSNGDTLDDDLLKPYHGVSWLENKGGLKFKEHRIASLYGCERAVAADMDGDGDLDVVAAAFLPQLGPDVWESKNLDSLIWVEQTGKNKWKSHSIEKSKCYHPTLAVADYDNDGKVDIATGNYAWLAKAEGGGGKPTFKADYVTLFTQK
jgi:hypothetical protein